MDHIKLNIIDISHDVVRQTLKSTLLVLKPSKVNYAPTRLSASTARVITKQTLIFVLFDITALTKNGT